MIEYAEVYGTAGTGVEILETDFEESTPYGFDYHVRLCETAGFLKKDGFWTNDLSVQYITYALIWAGHLKLEEMRRT